MGVAAECDGDRRRVNGFTERSWNTIEIGGFGARNTDYCILKGKSLRNRSIRFQCILSLIPVRFKVVIAKRTWIEEVINKLSGSLHVLSSSE